MRKNSIFAILAVLSLSLAACAGGSAETGNNNKGGSDNAKEDVIKATEELIIPEGVTTIEAEAYKNNKSIRKVVIPEGVTTIEEEAFASCTGLEEVIIPNSVTIIGESAFSDCANLTNVVIPDSVTRIMKYAFKGCDSLKEVTIPDGVTYIEEGVFYYCENLTNVVIPDSVISIGYAAFNCCDSLTNIVIPNSVTSIGEYAFNGCVNLKEVFLSANVSIGKKAFEESVVITGEAAVMLENKDKIEELALREIYKSIKISNISYVDDEGKKVTKHDVSIASVMDLMEKYAPKYKIMTKAGEVKTAKYMTSMLSNSFYDATSDPNATIYNWIEIPQANGGTFSMGVEIWRDLSKSKFDYINNWLRRIITDIDKAKDMEVQWEEPVTNPTETPEGESSEVVIHSSHDMDGRILDENLSVSELMDRVPSGACITSVNRRDGYIELRFEAGRKITVYDTNNGTSQEQWDEFRIWAEACERALEVLNTLK